MQTHTAASGGARPEHGASVRRVRVVGRRYGAAAVPSPVAAVRTWLACRDADAFPYDAVVAEYHRVGKHVVATDLLKTLAAARDGMADAHGSAEGLRVLAWFLDMALDKWDGRFANPTYLGLSLLSLPSVDEDTGDPAAAERRYDRLFVQLVADVMRFEVAAADGRTALQPQMRADQATTAKRCRLGLRALGPALRRLGLDAGVEEGDDPVAAARLVWTRVAAAMTAGERRTLALTVLPVSLVHDEYQFIRMLQSYEATFALVAVQLCAAVRALTDGEVEAATERMAAAERTLREAAPLWSMVATMRIEAFQTFRVFTDGASAIQSRNYKLMESLCRRPEATRLDSSAYLSAPEVRARVLAGQATLDDALASARTEGRISAGDERAVVAAMERFAATLFRWRKTHYQLAARMLGANKGTGYTEGASYLRSVQRIPVFASLAAKEAGEGAAEQEAAPVWSPAMLGSGETAATGRCPFGYVAGAPAGLGGRLERAFRRLGSLMGRAAR